MKTFELLKSYVMMIILLVCVSNSLRSQQVFDSLYSNILNEQRSLEIIVPDDYDSSKEYDVIYILDGEWNTQYTADLQGHIVRWGFMPKNILVGIRNTYINGVNQRSRDMTPTKSEPGANDGEAKAFVSFLKDELIPFIDNKYPTTGDNTLFGHSHGGTCTMFTFLTEPQLFKSYIASDPSLWWDDRYMSKLAAERLPEMKDVKASLHISGRAGSGYDGMGITTMDSVLTALKPDGLIWESDGYKNEIHNSVKHKGLYDGLKLSYRGHSIEAVEFHPQNGIVLKDKPTPIYMMDNPDNVYYTVDGTIPTMTSLPIQEMNMITGKTTIKAMNLGFRSGNKEATVGTYVEGSYIQPSSDGTGLQKGGMSFQTFKDTKSKKSTKKGITVYDFDLDVNLIKGGKVALEGYFKAETEGAYIFAIDKNEIEAKWELEDHTMIETNGESGVTSYTVPLSPGYHKIKITVSEAKVGNYNMGFYFLNPGDTQPNELNFPDVYYKN